MCLFCQLASHLFIETFYSPVYWNLCLLKLIFYALHIDWNLIFYMLFDIMIIVFFHSEMSFWHPLRCHQCDKLCTPCATCSLKYVTIAMPVFFILHIECLHKINKEEAKNDSKSMKPKSEHRSLFSLHFLLINAR